MNDKEKPPERQLAEAIHLRLIAEGLLSYERDTPIHPQTEAQVAAIERGIADAGRAVLAPATELAMLNADIQVLRNNLCVPYIQGDCKECDERIAEIVRLEAARDKAKGTKP